MGIENGVFNRNDLARMGVTKTELRRYLRDDDGWSLLREKQRMLVLILFMWLHERGEA